MMAMSGSTELQKITPKHRKFVKGLIGGQTSSAAARNAGFKDSRYGSYLMAQPAIQSLLLQQMEKAGISDDVLAKKLKDGLSARTPPKAGVPGRYEDHFVRKQFLDLIFKLRGDYAPEKIESTEKRIVIVFDTRSIAGLKDSGAISDEEANILDAEIVGTEDGENESSDGPDESSGDSKEAPVA